MPRRPKELVASIAEVLVYLDGPQLMLLRNPDDKRFIAVAVDQGGDGMHFFSAQISEDQWERYLHESVDLRYLFLYPAYKHWFTFDLLKARQKSIHLQEVHKDQINWDEVLPSSGFFARDHTVSRAQGIVAESTKERFAIDGFWGAADFSRFNGRLDDVYSILLTLKDFVSGTADYDLKKVSRAFADHPLRGGSSYGMFYDDLEVAPPFGERLALAQIHKSSPGFMEFRGRADILPDVRIAIEAYNGQRSEIREKYNALYRYLQRAKLLKEAASKFDRESPLAPHILAQATELAKLVHLDQRLDIIFRLTDSNALATAKVILSFVRRLEHLFRFFAEGRARLA